jgi:hypothetical protein
MNALVWDEVGDRTFQAGVDRGVLFMPDGTAAWNGLTGVDDSTPRSAQPYYQDGVKYLNYQVLGDYEGTLKAFTYPDLFDAALGLKDDGGVSFHDQYPQSFGLSYRTLLGDDVNGLERGYVIHILYDLIAAPSSQSFQTLGGQVTPVEFSWGLSATPKQFPGRRPTAHISIKSTDIDPAALQVIENSLYGTNLWEPFLPHPLDVVDTVTNPVEPLVVIDNGDGTFTVTGSVLAVRSYYGGNFVVDNPDAVMIDADTYTMPTTP